MNTVNTSMELSPQKLPNDVLVEIGMTCWRAYKAVFLVNRVVYDKLRTVRIKDIFYAERVDRKFDNEELEYYKYVLESLSIQTQIYINGELFREYNFCNRGESIPIRKLNNLFRFRRYGEYQYREESWYTNHSVVFIIRSRKLRRYIETHSITLEGMPDGVYMKYQPRPDPDGYIDDKWIIETPDGGFFHYNF